MKKNLSQFIERCELTVDWKWRTWKWREQNVHSIKLQNLKMQDVKKQDEIPGQKYSINRDYTTLQLSVQFFVVVVVLFSYLVKEVSFIHHNW